MVQQSGLYSHGAPTSALEAELNALTGAGVDAFTTRAAGGLDQARRLEQVAARIDTTDGGSGIVRHTVSVIALHGGTFAFETPWRNLDPFGSHTLKVDDLLDKLDEIKGFRKVG